jgi:Glycolipid transfer protein (GLTP)
MQKGTVTKKNSLARNVHRLRTVVVFTEKIMANLIRDAAMSLSGAVSAAYGDTLAPYHSTIVRTTCNAGFLLLPSRHSFLQSIGETGKDSSPHVLQTCSVRAMDMPSSQQANQQSEIFSC